MLRVSGFSRVICRKTRTAFFGAVAVVLVFGTPVVAQEEPRRAYLEVTAGLTAQPAATAYYHISPPLGGAGFPLLAAAGGCFIRPSLAVEGEFATGEVSAAQGFYYNWSQKYTALVRVTTVVGALRWKPKAVSPVELVVGGGRARVVHGTRDGIEYREYPYPQGSQTPMADSSLGDWVWSIKGGADVVFPRASRAAFVGSARVRWRQRVNEDDFRGVSAWAFDFGAGLRVRF
jgi:hypothetical protein